MCCTLLIFTLLTRNR
ncbi:small toxic polypeptide, partial [Escherichia coli]